MTKKKEAGATPQRYDEAFKQEAVRLWKSSGSDPAEQTEKLSRQSQHEALGSTVKHELVYCDDVRTRAEATTAIFEPI